MSFDILSYVSLGILSSGGGTTTITITAPTIATPSPLKGLALAATRTMFDQGQVGRDVREGSDGVWPAGTNWHWGGAIKCSMNDSPSGETQDGAQAPIVDAKVRLPIDTDITVQDRFRWLQRHGVALTTPQEYAVTSQPRKGVSALLVNLKLITGNTEN